MKNDGPNPFILILLGSRHIQQSSAPRSQPEIHLRGEVSVASFTFRFSDRQKTPRLLLPTQRRPGRCSNMLQEEVAASTLQRLLALVQGIVFPTRILYYAGVSRVEVLICRIWIQNLNSGSFLKTACISFSLFLTWWSLTHAIIQCICTHLPATFGQPTLTIHSGRSGH